MSWFKTSGIGRWLSAACLSIALTSSAQAGELLVACCRNDTNTCELRTADQCFALGVVTGTSCEPGPCSGGTPLACCIGAACRIATEQGCTQGLNGTPKSSTTCDPNPCASFEIGLAAGGVFNRKRITVPLDDTTIIIPEGNPGSPSCPQPIVPPYLRQFSSPGMMVDDHFFSGGVTLGGGGPLEGLLIEPALLTGVGSFGEGLTGGHPSAPCPTAPAQRFGTLWPFRDRPELRTCSDCHDCAAPNMIAAVFFPSQRRYLIQDQPPPPQEGAIRGATFEVAEDFNNPLDPRRFDYPQRGLFDDCGGPGLNSVALAAFNVRSLGGPQRPLLVTMEAGTMNLLNPDPATGLYMNELVPAAQGQRFVIASGNPPRPGGAGVNGLLAIEQGEYDPAPLAVQDTRTALDENTHDFDNARSRGSELDALYAKVVCEPRSGGGCEPVLRLFVAGNLASDGSNLEIFIDSIPGAGQGTLLGNNWPGAGNALNRMGTKTPTNGNTSGGPDGRGLTFEPGCEPDFYLNASLASSSLQGRLDLSVHIATLPTGGGGEGWFAGRINENVFMIPGDGILTGSEAGAPGVRASLSNLNFLGVGPISNGSAFGSADDRRLASEVATGMEFAIPLSAIGSPTGGIKIVAFINSPAHDFISNQLLPPIGGADAPGEPRNVEFASLPGMQCAAVGVPNLACFWDNGPFDRRDAQTSQVGLDQDWEVFARITADDFYLCEGQVHFVESVTGRITTNAVVPKALVVIFEDCDGRPNLRRPIAVLSAATPTSPPDDIPFVDGQVTLNETGSVYNGYREIDVEAVFEKPVILRGGTYWLSIVGFSGNANPLDEFFWGTAGDEVVKGRPGQFYDSEIGEWVDIDLLCCGCTDFNFNLSGTSCKLLFDNASPRLTGVLPGGSEAIYATPSLQNGTRTSDRSRSASDVVAPPCEQTEVCFVEGYVWTNCDRISLEFYRDGCNRPTQASPIAGPFAADCIIDTGLRASAPGSPIEVKLLKAQFFTFPRLTLERGRNTWVSLFAEGDNAQNARGYLALGDRCDRACDRLWAEPHVRGPAYAVSTWQPTIPEYANFDHAIAVAVRPGAETASTGSVPGCAADVNQSGDVTVQDLFDFLTAYFAGCP